MRYLRVAMAMHNTIRQTRGDRNMTQGELKQWKVSALHISTALKEKVVDSKHQYIPIEFVDEAKKDFPSVTFEKYMDGTDWYRVSPDEIRQLMRWRDKWFGAKP